jgi:outer membrane protein assembly factor BamB
MFNQVPECPRRGRLSRSLGLLAAVLVAALLVGGPIGVLNLSRRNTASHPQHTGIAIAKTQTPTLQSILSLPGLYLITQADASGNSQISRVDKNTGKVLWNHFIGTSESSAVVADNIVFGTSGDADAYGAVGTNPTNDHSYVYALSAQDGTQIWQTDLGADYIITASPMVIQGTPIPVQGYNLGVLGTPTFANGVIYVASADWKVYALNGANGAVTWTYDTHAVDYDMSSNTASFIPKLAVENGVVYGAAYNKLFAINAQNGHQIWSASARGQYTFGSPTVAGGRIYLSMDPPSTHTAANSEKSYIVAYSSNHGTKLWQSNGYYWAGFLDNAPVVANGLVYVANVYTGIYALDSQTGQAKWQHVLGTDAFTNSEGCSWPVVANGVVYSNCDPYKSPVLYAYNATNGSVIWSRASIANPDDSSNGVIYCTAFPGLIYFVRASDGATTLHKTYGVVAKNKFGNPSAPEPQLTLVP